MKKLVLYFGLLLVAGSGFIMNDFTKQQFKAGEQPLDMDVYMASLQPRATAFAKEMGPKIAGLPQMAKETTVAFFTNDGKGQPVQQTNRLGDLRKRSTPVDLSKPRAGTSSITSFGTRTGDTKEAAQAIGDMMNKAQAGGF